MDAHALADRLERDDDDDTTVTAFPDGSVDTFYDVAAGGDRVATRAAFAEAVAGGTDAFALDRTAVEPGGHATNLALQADALGNDVTLAGHLDDPAFADLPFDAVSMGEPATVSVYGFDDGDLLAVEESAAVAAWSLDDLREALGDGFEPFLVADAVCCTNWTAIEGLPDALASVAAVAGDVDHGESGDGGDGNGWFLFDSGAVAGRSDEAFERLFDALGRLTGAYDVVLAGNADEVTEMAGGLDAPTDDVDAALDALRRRSGVSAVVAHGEARAAAATPDGVVAAGNFDVEPSRHTGGGDRFDAGLVHALARGWGWAAALCLGNACASRYIATGDTGGPTDLAAFLRERA